MVEGAAAEGVVVLCAAVDELVIDVEGMVLDAAAIELALDAAA